MPVVLPNDPLSQSRHDDPPVLARYLPLWQLVHTVGPMLVAVRTEKVPTAQARQLTVCVSFAKRPLSQVRHKLWPCTEL